MEPDTISRLSLALLLVTGLALTAYFGTAAWRISEAGDADIVSGMPPALESGWHARPASTDQQMIPSSSR
jgi:hypothetical protein